jgi:O-antigen/teichoic acid export membrane protein
VSHHSTKKLYLHGLASSLVNLVVVSIYSLLVIRLSLTYLSKEEFGLLSLLAQVTTYISILDLGLYVAFSRILVDYNTGTRQHYANALRTASCIFYILGFIGLLSASLIAFAGAQWLSVPAALEDEFMILMLGQGLAIWAAFALKPLSAPIAADGKNYIIYWTSSILTILNAGIFWVALYGGLGIYSSFAAHTLQLIIFAVILWRISIPYFSAQNIRGVFDKSIFREVTSFARDSMLWQIGGQTLASLPIILASAWFALSATADLSAGMKLILLLVSVTTRFGDMSVQPLSIEYAKGNQLKAADQMTKIAGISGGIGVCAALFVICVNPAFLSWWLLDKISWNWQSNVSGALWIAILSVNQCMYGFAVIARQMQLLRWALLSECLIYVLLAMSMRTILGPDSLLIAKPVATLAIGIFLLVKMSHHTQIKIRKLLPGLLRQAIGLIMMIPVCIIVSDWIQDLMLNPFLAFLITVSVATLIIVAVVPLIFTSEMRFQIFTILKQITEKVKPKNDHNIPPI